jgi:hypothetical protein
LCSDFHTRVFIANKRKSEYSAAICHLRSAGEPAKVR